MKWLNALLLFFALTTHTSAQTFNGGFVEGLWFYDTAVFADVPTRIYVAVRNNTGADLTGTVTFYDNDTRIERTSISIVNGRLIESWADWKPSYGEHTVRVELSNIKLHTVGSSTETVDDASALAEQDIFVDYDSDGDGVGNEDDTDDDNDGYTDTQEKKHGTDPLDPNDPLPEEETDAASESSKSEDSETNSDTSEDTAINRSTLGEGPYGLEQFLNNNRADTALTSITNTVNTTKKRLDAYRASRSGGGSEGDVDAEESLRDSSASSTNTTTSSPTSSTPVNEDGFGEVSRSKAQKEKNSGFIGGAIDIAVRAIDSVYTLLLFLLSLYLAHPVVVQLTLLFLILFLVYKIAKRLGKRGGD